MWVRVTLAALPNGADGLGAAPALGGYATVDTHLVVDLAASRPRLRGRPVVFTRAGRRRAGALADAARAVHTSATELTRYAGRPYGPLAFGTSARSEHLTDWPGGGSIGIHGTDRPS